MAQWNKLLKTLGFTESESKIYLITLEMGPSAVQDIAKKAGVSRVTTYTVIESLTEHGLMSSVQKGKKTLYASEAPERLLSYMQNRMKGMESTLREVEVAINDLKLLQRGERPIVRLVEGPEALKSIHDDILNTKHEEEGILEISNLDALHSIFTDAELQPFKNALEKKQISAKGIVLTQAATKPMRGRTTVRYVPKHNFSFSGDIIMYGNKVAFSTFEGKLIGVVIESKVVADTMRDLFRLAWSGKDLE